MSAYCQIKRKPVQRLVMSLLPLSCIFLLIYCINNGRKALASEKVWACLVSRLVYKAWDDLTSAFPFLS